jgi:serine/threonine protein kinase
MKSAGPRIVVFEENLEEGSRWKSLLEAGLSARVQVHTHALEGLLACMIQPPKVVLLGRQLEEIGAAELLRRLSALAQTQSVPVVWGGDIPALTLKDLASLGVQVGRPLDPGDPLAAVKDALAAGASPAGFGEPREYAGYTLTGVLGSGGLGTVYDATHPTHGRVALKVILKSPAVQHGCITRLLGEAKALRGLRHRNLQPILQVEDTGPAVIIATPLVQGRTLMQLLDAACLTLPDKRNVVTQAIDAVNHLHSQGVLHRDIRPSNFLRRQDGVLLLSDHGLARAPEFLLATAKKLGVQADFFGTTATVAPEVLAGGEATVLSDQYSLGRTIQCILENSRPTQPHVPLRETRPELPAELSEALMRMAHPDPAQRFPQLSAAKTAVLMNWPFDPEVEHSLFT